MRSYILDWNSANWLGKSLELIEEAGKMEGGVALYCAGGHQVCLCQRQNIYLRGQLSLGLPMDT